MIHQIRTSTESGVLGAQFKPVIGILQLNVKENERVRSQTL